MQIREGRKGVRANVMASAVSREGLKHKRRDKAARIRENDGDVASVLPSAAEKDGADSNSINGISDPMAGTGPRVDH